MIDARQYTSGRIAVANLVASIESLEHRRVHQATFEDLATLSKLLFLRGDVLGRIADHDRAELVANEAVALSPRPADGLYIRARLAGRFHRFAEAGALLDQALAAGYSMQEVDAERAALLQATGKYRDALVLRKKLAKDNPGIHTLGALATLLSEMDQSAAAEQRWSPPGDRLTWLSLGVRPAYHFSRYFSLELETGFDHTRQTNALSGSLMKVTLAPQITPGSARSAGRRSAHTSLGLAGATASRGWSRPFSTAPRTADSPPACRSRPGGESRGGIRDGFVAATNAVKGPIELDLPLSGQVEHVGA